MYEFVANGRTAVDRALESTVVMLFTVSRRKWFPDCTLKIVDRSIRRGRKKDGAQQFS